MQDDSINRQWRLRERPREQIDAGTFELVHAAIPEPAAGEFLVRVCYLSLAPVMRAYVTDGGVIERPLDIGAVMRGRGVGYVVASRHPDFAEGDIVHGPFGWQDYALSDGTGRVVKMHHWAHSISTGLGILGLTGFTGYFGMFDKGRPRPGDAVLVSGALGGVGSVAGQLARIAGAVPVAICGSEEKCRIAVDDLGYADAINYRTDDVPARIAAMFPNGIDVYFDNVGGPTLEAAIDNMAFDGRIVVCGSISQYLNADGSPRGPSNYFQIVYRHVSLLGFHIYSYEDRYAEAERRMAQWIEEGQLIQLEDRLEGMEVMPEALIGLFTGDNIGKRVVQIADEPPPAALSTAAQ